MDELQKHAQLKKPDTKGYILYDSIHMKCPEEENPQREKADGWLPEAGGAGRGMGTCLVGAGFPFVAMKDSATGLC